MQAVWLRVPYPNRPDRESLFAPPKSPQTLDFIPALVRLADFPRRCPIERFSTCHVSHFRHLANQRIFPRPAVCGRRAHGCPVQDPCIHATGLSSSHLSPSRHAPHCRRPGHVSGFSLRYMELLYSVYERITCFQLTSNTLLPIYPPRMRSAVFSGMAIG